MKVKTSIALSDTLLKEIDDLVEYSHNRSTLIEEALREYIERNKKSSTNQRDLELINDYADELNQEAVDVLSYQVGI